MRIQIRFRIQLITFDADPNEDPDPDFYVIWMRIWIHNTGLSFTKEKLM
jgi:hypothetical protein